MFTGFTPKLQLKFNAYKDEQVRMLHIALRLGNLCQSLQQPLIISAADLVHYFAITPCEQWFSDYAVHVTQDTLREMYRQGVPWLQPTRPSFYHHSTGYCSGEWQLDPAQRRDAPLLDWQSTLDDFFARCSLLDHEPVTLTAEQWQAHLYPETLPPRTVEFLLSEAATGPGSWVVWQGPRPNGVLEFRIRQNARCHTFRIGQANRTMPDFIGPHYVLNEQPAPKPTVRSGKTPPPRTNEDQLRWYYASMERKKQAYAEKLKRLRVQILPRVRVRRYSPRTRRAQTTPT